MKTQEQWEAEQVAAAAAKHEEEDFQAEMKNQQAEENFDDELDDREADYE